MLERQCARVVVLCQELRALLERQCARVVVLCQELNQPCWNVVSQSICFVADTVINAGTAASQS